MGPNGELLCRSCGGRVTPGGRVRLVPTLGILMLIHGVVLVLVSVLFLFGVGLLNIGLLSVPARAPAHPGDPPPEAVLAMADVVYAVMILGALVPGIMQIFGGYFVYNGRRYRFAMAALFAGLTSMCVCYCGPTAVGLLVFGLIVLLDNDVKQEFARRSQAL